MANQFADIFNSLGGNGATGITQGLTGKSLDLYAQLQNVAGQNSTSAFADEYRRLANLSKPVEQKSGTEIPIIGPILRNRGVQLALKPLEVFALPSRAIWSTIQEASDFASGQNASWSDWYNQVKDSRFGAGSVIPSTGNKWLDRFVGFAGDVGLDPLTYVSLGAGRWASQSGRNALAATLTGAGASEELVAKAAQRGVTAFNTADRAAARALGVELGEAGLRFMGERLPGTTKFAETLGSTLAAGRFKIGTSAVGTAARRLRAPEGLEVILEKLASGKGPGSVRGAASVLSGRGFRDGYGKEMLLQVGKQLDETVFPTLKDTDNALLRADLEGIAPEVTGAGQAVRQWLDNVWTRLEESGIKMPNKRPNYLPHIWTQEGRELLKADNELGDTLRKLFKITKEEIDTPSILQERVIKQGKYKIAGREVEFVTGTIDEINEKISMMFPELAGVKILVDDIPQLLRQYAFRASRAYGNHKFLERLRELGVADFVDAEAISKIDTKASAAANKAVSEDFKNRMAPQIKKMQAERAALVKQLKEEVKQAVDGATKILNSQVEALSAKIKSLDAEFKVLLSDLDALYGADNVSAATRRKIEGDLKVPKKGKRAGKPIDDASVLIPENANVVDVYQRLIILREKFGNELDNAMANANYAQGTSRLGTARGAVKSAYDDVVYLQATIEQLDNLEAKLADNFQALREFDVRNNVYRKGDFPTGSDVYKAMTSSDAPKSLRTLDSEEARLNRELSKVRTKLNSPEYLAGTPLGEEIDRLTARINELTNEILNRQQLNDLENQLFNPGQRDNYISILSNGKTRYVEATDANIRKRIKELEKTLTRDKKIKIDDLIVERDALDARRVEAQGMIPADGGAAQTAALQADEARLVKELEDVQALREQYVNGSIPALVEKDPSDIGRALLDRGERGTGMKFANESSSAAGTFRVRTATMEVGRIRRNAWSVIEALVPNTGPRWQIFDTAMTQLDEAERAYALSKQISDKIESIRLQWDNGISRYRQLETSLSNGGIISESDQQWFNDFANEVLPQHENILNGTIVANEKESLDNLYLARQAKRDAERALKEDTLIEYRQRIDSPYLSEAVKDRMTATFTLMVDTFNQIDDIFSTLRAFKRQGSFQAQAVANEAATVARHLDEITRFMKFQHDFVYNYDRALAAAAKSNIAIDPIVAGNTIYSALLKQEDVALAKLENKLINEFEETLKLAIADESRFNAVMKSADEVPDLVDKMLVEYYDTARRANNARERLRRYAKQRKKVITPGKTTVGKVTRLETVGLTEQEQIMKIALGPEGYGRARPKTLGEDTSPKLADAVERMSASSGSEEFTSSVANIEAVDVRSADAINIGYQAAEEHYDGLLQEIREQISYLITGNKDALASKNAWADFQKRIKYKAANKSEGASWSVNEIKSAFLENRKLSKRAVGYVKIAASRGVKPGTEGVDVLQMVIEEIRRVRALRDEGFSIRQGLGDLSMKSLPPVFSETYSAQRGLSLMLAPGTAEVAPFFKYSIVKDNSALGFRLKLTKSNNGMSFTDWMQLSNEIPVKLREGRSKLRGFRADLKKQIVKIDELEDQWLLSLRRNELERQLIQAGQQPNTDAFNAALARLEQSESQKIFARRQRIVAARSAAEDAEPGVNKFTAVGVKLPELTSETVSDITSTVLRELRSRARAGETIVSKDYLDSVASLIKSMRDSGFKLEVKGAGTAVPSALVDDLGDQLVKLSDKDFEQFVLNVQRQQNEQFIFPEDIIPPAIDKEAQASLAMLERGDKNIALQRQKLALERAKGLARYQQMKKDLQFLEKVAEPIQTTFESYMTVGKKGGALKPGASWQDYLFGKKTYQDELRRKSLSETLTRVESQMNDVNDRLMRLETEIVDVGTQATTRETLQKNVIDAIERSGKRQAAAKNYRRLEQEISDLQKQIKRIEQIRNETNLSAGVIDSGSYDQQITRLTEGINARREALRRFNEQTSGQSVEEAKAALRRYDSGVLGNRQAQMRTADIVTERNRLTAELDTLREQRKNLLGDIQELLIPTSTRANNKYYTELGNKVAETVSLRDGMRPRLANGEVDIEAEALGYTRRDQILGVKDAQGNTVLPSQFDAASANLAAAETSYYEQSARYSTRDSANKVQQIDDALNKVRAEIDQAIPLRMNSAAASQWLVGELTDMRSAVSAIIDRFKSFRVARIGEKDFNIEELRMFLADLDASLDGFVPETPFMRQEMQSAMMERRRALANAGKADATPEATAVKILIQNALKTEGELLMLGDSIRELRALMNEAASPEFGQIVVKQLKDGWEEIANSGIAVGPEARALLQRTELLAEPKEWAGFVRAWDTYNSVFKAYATMSPRFHVRNAMSATFINWADGVKSEDMIEGAKLWAKISRDPEGWINDIPSNLREQYRTAVLATYASGAGQFDDIAAGGKAVNWWLPKVSRKVGRQVEGSVRLGMALNSVKNGAGFDETLARIVRAHFNYSDVSKLDMFARRTFAPFWIFMSRNIPLQVQQMWTKPRAYAIYQHFVKNLSGDSEYTPMNIVGTDSFKAPFGGDLYINPDLGFNRIEQDIMSFTDPAKLMSGASPVARYPFEMWAGQQFYNNRPISSSKYVPLEGVSALLAPVLEGMGLVEVNANGQKVINEKTLYSIQNLVPYAGTIDRLAGAGSLGSRAGYSQASFFGLPVTKGTSKDADIYARIAAMEKLQAKQKGLGY